MPKSHASQCNTTEWVDGRSRPRPLIGSSEKNNTRFAHRTDSGLEMFVLVCSQPLSVGDESHIYVCIHMCVCAGQLDTDHQIRIISPVFFPNHRELCENLLVVFCSCLLIAFRSVIGFNRSLDIRGVSVIR